MKEMKQISFPTDKCGVQCISVLVQKNEFKVIMMWYIYFDYF